MTSSNRAYEIVSLIPKGKVLTYTDVAKLTALKNPRTIGNILHKNKDFKNVPCHRVVKKTGFLAREYADGGLEAQAKKLREEGIEVINNQVNLNKYRWQVKIISKKLIKLPKRKKTSQKGDNGRVLIIGGSPEYIGAPGLAGIAALRSGADSVIIAAPEKVAWAINCLSPDLVTVKLKSEHLSLDNYPQLGEFLEKADCILVGTGVSETKKSLELIKTVIENFQGFKILDAAGLFCFDKTKLSKAILLPNQNEYQRLITKHLDLKTFIDNDNIVVAKSHRTKIFSSQGIFENRTGNPGLTKAGTGDVLAGLIAGFVAQSKNPLQSAINAVYFIGRVGDILLKKKRGYFYLASDLAEEISRVKAQMSKPQFKMQNLHYSS